MTELDLTVSQEKLRLRQGAKWTRYPADVIPAWIADMDFPVAPEIRASLQAIMDTEDFGYPPYTLNQQATEAYSAWMRARHGWTPDPARTLVLSNMMQAMHAMVMMFSEPGDGVIVQTPIYPGFLSVVAQNNRRLDENPLVRGTQRYEMDMDGLRRKIDPRTRILLLCNPHNPCGRAFDVTELRALAELALRHNLIVIANEVHMDLVYSPARYTPFASLGPEIVARTVTLSSTSKGFNIAGLRCAVAHFGSAELKTIFERINVHTLGTPSIFSIAGSAAAWRHGGAALDTTLIQLDKNRRRIADFVKAKMPGVKYLMPEATYLAWLDCSALGLPETPAKYFLNRAKIAFSPGGDFSSYTDQFIRLNFATSPEILEEILSRMDRALKG